MDWIRLIVTAVSLCIYWQRSRGGGRMSSLEDHPSLRHFEFRRDTDRQCLLAANCKFELFVDRCWKEVFISQVDSHLCTAHSSICCTAALSRGRRSRAISRMCSTRCSSDHSSGERQFETLLQFSWTVHGMFQDQNKKLLGWRGNDPSLMCEPVKCSVSSILLGSGRWFHRVAESGPVVLCQSGCPRTRRMSTSA